LIDKIAEDELVSKLLVLRGLHPLDLETRVRCALDLVKPRLGLHSGDVDLLGVTPGWGSKIAPRRKLSRLSFFATLGRNAAVIGEIIDEHPGIVMMKSRVGGTRVVDMLSGEQLPRIC
jgi:hypothetical protein